MKISALQIILLTPVVLGSPESTESIPFSETVSIEGPEDQYTLDVTVPIYVKKGATYEIEERVIRIVIAPQDKTVYVWTFFLKVFVSIDITDSTGEMTADFQSYLNGNLKNCDLITPEGQLFWDHAGEKRADKAGEPFTDTPMTVKDAHCTVRMRLINVLYAQYLADIYPGERESDLECLLPLRGLTVGINIDYSPDQKIIVDLFEKASEHEQAGDTFFQAEERKPVKPEILSRTDEFKNLKHQLATGEITLKEYEKTKSALKLKNLKYRLATGEITLKEYEKAKSALKD